MIDFQPMRDDEFNEYLTWFVSDYRAYEFSGFRVTGINMFREIPNEIFVE